MRIIVDNKLKGEYAEADLNKRTIRINKKHHFQKKFKRINPTQDGHENMTSTLHHELLHFKYPYKSEKDIRKKEKSDMKTMSQRKKNKLLAKLY